MIFRILDLQSTLHPKDINWFNILKKEFHDAAHLSSARSNYDYHCQSFGSKIFYSGEYEKTNKVNKLGSKLNLKLKSEEVAGKKLSFTKMVKTRNLDMKLLQGEWYFNPK